MITNELELNLSRIALRSIESALLALKCALTEKIPNTNSELFDLMSQDYHKQIALIRSEIDEYLGLHRKKSYEV